MTPGRPDQLNLVNRVADAIFKALDAFDPFGRKSIFHVVPFAGDVRLHPRNWKQLSSCAYLTNIQLEAGVAAGRLSAVVLRQNCIANELFKQINIGWRGWHRGALIKRQSPSNCRSRSASKAQYRSPDDQAE